jgi:hypothetical protein
MQASPAIAANLSLLKEIPAFAGMTQSANFAARISKHKNKNALFVVKHRASIQN